MKEKNKRLGSLNNCYLCPKNCGVNRSVTTGFCGASTMATVAKSMLHLFEEPCISGTVGSGAIFFCGCNMRCGYCQNRDISFINAKSTSFTPLSATELAAVMCSLQNKGAHNINLVTPDHLLWQIADALVLAKPKLKIPVIYNGSGYAKAEAIALLNGLVDVYLPDFKYADAQLAQKCSAAPDYCLHAIASITEMVEQVGQPVYDADGLIQRGVLIRHLVLPGFKENSLAVLSHIEKNFPHIPVSIMRQYTPLFNTLHSLPSLDRKLTTYEYNTAIHHALNLKLTGYMQGKESVGSCFTPDFLDK